MDEVITGMMMPTDGEQMASPQDMAPELISRRPRPPYGTWPQQSNPFEDFGRSMPPAPPMQAPPFMGEMAPSASDQGTQEMQSRMLNPPSNVRGRMPVAPDTRERQYQAQIDELMRIVQQAQIERMQREAEERQRAAEQDIPGPFPRQDFPVTPPKMYGI